MDIKVFIQSSPELSHSNRDRRDVDLPRHRCEALLYQSSYGAAHQWPGESIFSGGPFALICR